MVRSKFSIELAGEYVLFDNCQAERWKFAQPLIDEHYCQRYSQQDVAQANVW
jgi:hypothetical protein